MAEFRDEIPDAPACPLLGLAADSETHFTFPHAGHRCHGSGTPTPIDLPHQAGYCLSANFATCSRYGQRVGRDAAARPASHLAAALQAEGRHSTGAIDVPMRRAEAPVHAIDGPAPATEAPVYQPEAPARAPGTASMREAEAAAMIEAIDEDGLDEQPAAHPPTPREEARQDPVERVVDRPSVAATTAEAASVGGEHPRSSPRESGFQIRPRAWTSTGDAAGGSTKLGASDVPTGAGRPGSAYGLPTGAGRPGSAYGLPTGAGRTGGAYGLPTGAGRTGGAYGLPTGPEPPDGTDRVHTGSGGTGGTHAAAVVDTRRVDTPRPAPRLRGGVTPGAQTGTDEDTGRSRGFRSLLVRVLVAIAVVILLFLIGFGGAALINDIGARGDTGSGRAGAGGGLVGAPGGLVGASGASDITGVGSSALPGGSGAAGGSSALSGNSGAAPGVSGAPSPGATAPAAVTSPAATSPGASHTSAPAPTPTPRTRSVIHIVQKGETVIRIAAEYGVTPQQIITANKLRDPNLIIPGERLVIPPP